MKFRELTNPIDPLFKPITFCVTIENELELEIMKTALGKLTNGVGYELFDFLNMKYKEIRNGTPK